jgi:hypothetical protein
VEDRPAEGLSVHDAVFEVGSRLLRIRGSVDPASTSLVGGAMVRGPSPPGSKEKERSMAARGDKLTTSRPESGVDEARKPRRLRVRHHKPAPPARDRLEVVGGLTQPRPLRARRAPPSARLAARSVPLEARGPRAAQPYTCASVRRPPLSYAPNALLYKVHPVGAEFPRAPHRRAPVCVATARSSRLGLGRPDFALLLLD